MNLTRGLSLIPDDWDLVPTNANKQPLGVEWQHYPQSASQIRSQLSIRGKVWVLGRRNLISVVPQGIGIITGNGIVALDIDGDAQLLNLPPTVTFTSGRPGHCQYLFRVPRNFEGRPRRFENWELRYTGQMSVLPPSRHPTTGRYQWINSPLKVTIAPAPDWVKQKMGLSQPHSEVRLEYNVTQTHIKSALNKLNPIRYNDYHEWVRVGMALKSHSEELLPLWDEWSRNSTKYKPGECMAKWRSSHHFGE